MTPPLSLYVHLPWCVSKCPYCDFNSHRAGEAPPRGRYVDALAADLAAESSRVAGRRLQTVFIGGGTPSLFTGEEIGRILDAVRAGFDLDPDAEVTLEVNPGTVEHGDPAGYRAAGVNRLSIGAQSFHPDTLRRLGRIHGPADVERTVAEARRAGFDNLNLDLMFALPGQTAEMALADIERALELAPEHLSYYQLALEPNTVFHRRPPAGLPDDDAAALMQDEAFALLDRAGYERYEVSAFARPGRRCRHNLNYWEFGDYLGVGAGAHGKLTDAAGRVWRPVRPAHPRAYMEAALAGDRWAPAVPVGREDLAFEYMLNALRLPGGFTEAGFEARTGLGWTAVESGVAAARERGLMVGAAGRWRPTALGLRFLNDLQGRFLPPDPAPR